MSNPTQRPAANSDARKRAADRAARGAHAAFVIIDEAQQLASDGLATFCAHDSATGIDDTPVGPTKVWACDHCGVRWTYDGTVKWPAAPHHDAATLTDEVLTALALELESCIWRGAPEDYDGARQALAPLIAAVRAQAKAEALREAAADVYAFMPARVARWLEDRAAQIEWGTTHATDRCSAQTTEPTEDTP